MATNPARSRSPSTGRQANLSNNNSALGFTDSAKVLGVDPSLTAAYTDQSFQQLQGNSFLQPQAQQQFAQNNLGDPSSQFAHQQQQQQQQYDPNDFTSFADTPEQSFDASAFLDPTLLDQQGALQSSETAEQLYMNMAALSQASPENPRQLSAHSSPAHQSNPYGAPQQSQVRNASLDPASAANMTQGIAGTGGAGDWTGAAFRNHRRSPSDQYSDVSSQGQPSPFMRYQDQFESFSSHSPLLNGQPDPVLLPDSLSGFGGFSLSDPQQQQQQQQIQSYTPSHSPHISPNLSPQQQPMPQFNTNDSFGMLSNTSDNNGSHYTSPTPQQVEGFPIIQQTGSNPDLGQADQMSPPEIRFEPAPPSKQNSFNHELQGGPSNDGETLFPPQRGSGRSRSQSNPASSNSSRAGSPMARPRSPSQPLAGGLHPTNSASRHSSRSPSPTGAGIHKQHSRRSSTSSVPHNREAMLNLADPTRQTSPGIANPVVNAIGPGGTSTGSEGNKRAQKHPATFQCHLCPKRFTRAYNLRSHLRTHTDERPFVCTVCGKAFARQHDRKRHESLHSGEKRFVCRGLLSANGDTWGCNRRFARADALGRHFRSEAGRACIRPLLDEEARERESMMLEQQMYANAGGLVAAPPPQVPLDFGAGSNFLPAALLQQFPALAEIQWDNLPPADAGGGNDDGDYEGRSSFEASDFDFDDDQGGSGYVSGPGMGSDAYVQGGSWGHGAQGNGWASDVGDR